jgi:glycerol-3-phosphate dehydrogenase (NAD(P)+)
VLGGGAWGTTLSTLIAATSPTTLWAREPDVVTAIRDHHDNPVFLPGVSLPPAIWATNELGEAVADADAVVVAIPAQHVRPVISSVGEAIEERALVLSVVKGIETGSGMRVTEVLRQLLPHIEAAAIGVLSGPNLAREVITGHPSAATVAFASPDASGAIQRLLLGPTFRVYTSHDVIGCEIGGAVKNVIAIAAGVADGLGCGMNTIAALITRGLAEITRLGVALGADPLTFLGLAGNGDLIATCVSTHSRNHRVGRELAAGRKVDEIVAGMTSVAEGVATTPAVVELARRTGVELPIAEAVLAVFDGRLDPTDAIATLMGRPSKPELEHLAGASAFVATDT